MSMGKTKPEKGRLSSLNRNCNGIIYIMYTGLLSSVQKLLHHMMLVRNNGSLYISINLALRPN